MIKHPKMKWMLPGLFALAALLPWRTAQAQMEDARLRANVGVYAIMLTKPGLRGGVEYAFIAKDRAPRLGFLFNNQSKDIHTRWVVAPQVATYWDPLSFVAVQGSLEVGRSVQQGWGLVRHWRVGPGIYRAFLPEVYTVEGDQVTFDGLESRQYGMLSATFGVGYALKESIVQANLHAMVIGLYNATLLPMAGVELVYQFDPKSLRR